MLSDTKTTTNVPAYSSTTGLVAALDEDLFFYIQAVNTRSLLSGVKELGHNYCFSPGHEFLKGNQFLKTQLIKRLGGFEAETLAVSEFHI